MLFGWSRLQAIISELNLYCIITFTSISNKKRLGITEQIQITTYQTRNIKWKGNQGNWREKLSIYDKLSCFYEDVKKLNSWFESNGAKSKLTLIVQRTQVYFWQNKFLRQS